MSDQYFAGLDLGKKSDYSALCVLRKQKVDELGNPPLDRGMTVYPGTAEVLQAQVAVQAQKQPPLVSRYDCSALQRFDLKTPYPDIVSRVAALFLNPKLKGQTLVVDETGVGAAVVDMFRRAKTDPVRCPKCDGKGLVFGNIPELPPLDFVEAAFCATCNGSGKILLNATIRPVTITAGSKASPDGAGFRVAKAQLVSVLQVLLQWTPSRLRIDPALSHAHLLVNEMNNFKVKVSAAANESYESWREADHDDLVLCVAIAAWVAERGVQKLWLR